MILTYGDMHTQSDTANSGAGTVAWATRAPAKADSNTSELRRRRGGVVIGLQRRRTPAQARRRGVTDSPRRGTTVSMADPSSMVARGDFPYNPKIGRFAIFNCNSVDKSLDCSVDPNNNDNNKLVLLLLLNLVRAGQAEKERKKKKQQQKKKKKKKKQQQKKKKMLGMNCRTSTYSCPSPSCQSGGGDNGFLLNSILNISPRLSSYFNPLNLNRRRTLSEKASLSSDSDKPPPSTSTSTSLSSVSSNDTHTTPKVFFFFLLPSSFFF
ncbi:hypothetical protein TIFTF001_004787 [Ficus carica]|uniref:Uncharacterized protein n=1 Tax=Ficus carica TaxID=3494 RepID=A0AA88CXS6_FICCA|nr:hypothetical protein TIFTF001_004787 [Ficus carica]